MMIVAITLAVIAAIIAVVADQMVGRTISPSSEYFFFRITSAVAALVTLASGVTAVAIWLA